MDMLFQLLRALSSRRAPAAGDRPRCRAPWFPNCI